MSWSERYKRFIDERARKPSGKIGIQSYNNPKAHLKSFQIVIRELALREDDEFVEIGCGGGILLKTALRIVKRACALDHSSDMVELSRKNNAADFQSGKADIIRGDAAALPWESDSFTTAASANMFFFVEEPEAVIAEIYRVLKPGGRFCMITMSNNLLGKIAFGFVFKLKTYSKQTMKKLLENAGFKGVKVREQFPFAQICYAVKPG